MMFLGSSFCVSRARWSMGRDGVSFFLFSMYVPLEFIVWEVCSGG